MMPRGYFRDGRDFRGERVDKGRGGPGAYNRQFD